MPVIKNPTPPWLRKENSSVMDSTFEKVVKMLAGLIGADDPSGQAMGIAAPVEVPGGASSPVVQAIEAIAKKAKGIRAFHGSPHDFDQFSLSKIGTGEGAQAYGHGLYFAERPEVAKEYQKTLAKKNRGNLLPQHKEPRSPEQNVTDLWLAHVFQGGSKKEATKELAKLKDNLAAKGLPTSDVELALDKIAKSSGRMYEVNIHADPEDFLDWDAPLSQQPRIAERLGVPQAERLQKRLDELVAAKAAKAADRLPNKMMRDEKGWHALAKEAETVQAELNRIGSGADYWNDLRLQANPEYVDDTTWQKAGPAAAEKLKAQGIPGIKYLDGASRSAGQGSRNYVVFDDKLISIVKKYGIAGALSAGAINEMQARQLQEQGYQ